MFTALLFAAALPPSVWFRGSVEIAFVVLLAIIVRFCYHLSNLSFRLNTAEKANARSVTLRRTSLIPVFPCIYRSVICSASRPSFAFGLQNVNWMVNIAGSPRVPGPPGGVSKEATRSNRNEGAVGDWVLQRGWQMLMLTDRESDYSELRRWTGACAGWLPLQQNHSQSHLHKSRTHILAQFGNSTIERRWWCWWKSAYHERVPVTTGAVHSRRTCAVLTLGVFKLSCELLIPLYLFFLCRAFRAYF